MLNRREFGVATLALGASQVVPAVADERWPSRLIRLVVPFPPAGANDLIGRVMAEKLSKALGQTVIVENKPGAGGTIGATAVANSDPDGYTIMIGYIGNLAYASTIYKNLPYDPITSFSAVSLVAKVPNVLVVNPSLPIHSVKDLIEYTKQNPSKMAFSSGGNGTAAHIGMAYLCHLSGISMVHVPYRGTAPSITGLIGGQVQVTMAVWPGIRPFVQSGQIRAIGVSSKVRVPYAPAIPTIAESGLPEFEAVQWYGIVAPSKTPSPIIKRLNSEIGALLETPDLQKYMTNDGALPEKSTPEEFQKYIASEIGRWREVIIGAGIQPS